MDKLCFVFIIYFTFAIKKFYSMNYYDRNVLFYYRKSFQRSRYYKFVVYCIKERAWFFLFTVAFLLFGPTSIETSAQLTHLYFSRLQILLGFAAAVRLDLGEAKVRWQDLVWQKILILPIDLMRLLQLLEMISLRRGHFRRVLYSLQLIPGWLRQIARADSKSVFIVRRVRDRLQNSICVNVGISWGHKRKS